MIVMRMQIATTLMVLISALAKKVTLAMGGIYAMVRYIVLVFKIF